MYQTLLGEGGFRKGMDLYFERHDGQAVSCDDFRAAMADANNVDLDQFERWYLQVRDTVTIHRLTPWRYDTRQDGIWDMRYGICLSVLARAWRDSTYQCQQCLKIVNHTTYVQRDGNHSPQLSFLIATTTATAPCRCFSLPTKT